MKKAMRMRGWQWLGVAVVAAGCGSTGVGDPCLPAPPDPMVAADGTRTLCPTPENPQGGCFLGTEVYIETRSLQCRTRVCMAYKYDQHNDLSGAMRTRNVFCSCRCSGPGDRAALCTCPSGFVCQDNIFVTGDPGVVGGYCVRSELAPDAGTGSH